MNLGQAVIDVQESILFTGLCPDFSFGWLLFKAAKGAELQPSGKVARWCPGLHCRGPFLES